jgi:hypothetical protein
MAQTRLKRKITGLLLDPAVITPDDTAANLNEYDVFHIATAGAVVVDKWPRDPDLIGNAVTLTLTAGYHPIPITKIWSTGTTATGISGYIQSD